MQGVLRVGNSVVALWLWLRRGCDSAVVAVVVGLWEWLLLCSRIGEHYGWRCVYVRAILCLFAASLWCDVLCVRIVYLGSKSSVCFGGGVGVSDYIL